MSTRDSSRYVAGMAAKYGGRLRRFLKLHLANASDVPDLAQEVFLRLLRVRNCEDIRSPENYLFTVASHVIQQHAQRAATVPATVDIADFLSDLQLISADDPGKSVEAAQQLQLLEQALDKMPPRVAMALVLHRLSGKTVDEIARDLGVAQITVKKYLAKALLQCRDTCDRDGGL
jgi:RNA polymerase sigma factor (sigma-70 family)